MIACAPRMKSTFETRTGLPVGNIRQAVHTLGCLHGCSDLAVSSRRLLKICLA